MNYITNETAKRDIVTGLYGAIASGELEAAAQFLDAGVVLHVPGTHSLAGEHRGLAEFARFSQQSRALTVGGEQIRILDILEGDDHVAVYCRVRAERPNGALL